jgi:diadenosine tetraphosphate (Ap4A) HIT family hydrolase
MESMAMTTDREAPRKLEEWKRTRRDLLQRIQQLRRQGICYICQDLKTQEVFGRQCVIWEDDEFRVVLDRYPRVEGHTILTYKPHREDVSELSEEEAALVFQMCVRVVKAIKAGLGAEKVYVLTMCDGPINHLNFQLLPRYPGNLMGYRRLALERRPLEHGEETAAEIRAALESEEDG